jgi:hypothetical protein
MPTRRLGITLDVTLAIVPNARVRRDKADISVPQFVADIRGVSQAYLAASAAAGGAAATHAAVWEALKAWDETQVCWCGAVWCGVRGCASWHTADVAASRGVWRVLPGRCQRRADIRACTPARLHLHTATCANAAVVLLHPRA